MLKSYIAGFILLLCSTNLVLAQRSKVPNMRNYDHAPYHFGFLLGSNQMLFTLKPTDGLHEIRFNHLAMPDVPTDSSMLYGVSTKPTYGFTIGIVSNLRMGKYFDLRFIPSLSFGERNIEYSILNYRNGNEELISITKKIPSTFVEFPLHVKYKGKRMHNARPYILGGINYKLDLASQEKKKAENNDVIIKINRSDIYAEIGVGFDFYANWFKFGTEIKMSYSPMDILQKDATIYTGGLESIKSKIFQVSFTFE